MKKLWRFLRWLDDNLIKILVIGYIFIIPLYPKFPLKTINFTYIAIRLEDLYVALMVVVFAVYLIRKKVSLNMAFFKWFLLFWLAVFASYFYSITIGNTMPYRQLAFLHAARRVQYMVIFFIAGVTVRKKEDFLQYIRWILIVLFMVCVYGLGQKFIGWPAVQTMNPEFARGHLLMLTPEARISSTFAGHYDLAAYLVLLMPLILGAFYYRKHFWYFLMFVLALFSLVLTASRISLGAYAVSILAFLIFLRKPKMLLIVIIMTISFSLLSKNLTSRFLKTVQIKQLFVNEQTGQVVVPEKVTSKELPAGTFYVPIEKKETKGKTKANEALVKEKILSDLRWEASREGRILTASEESKLLATMSAGLKPVNTVVADISFATRLQVEWPRAWKAFLSNPILGTGPASITESTDNDYLRWIGEFGLFGTLSFIYIIFLIAWTIWKKALKTSGDEKYLYYGFLFGLGGLMLNASYIDVFEASKVAYTFWMVSGIYIAFVCLPQSSAKAQHKKI